MVYFLFGTNIQKRSIEETWRDIQNQGNIQANGTGTVGKLINVNFYM